MILRQPTSMAVAACKTGSDRNAINAGFLTFEEPFLLEVSKISVEGFVPSSVRRVVRDPIWNDPE